MNSNDIGILVNHSLYQGIPRGRMKHEKLSFYESAGREFGLSPCYFRIQDIDLSRRKVSAYRWDGVKYIRCDLPLPSVIHNRAILQKASAKRKIQRLLNMGIIVYNSSTRYLKSRIQSLLMLDSVICPHLPGTVQASASRLRYYMTQYDSLILKPDNSSIGKGIMKLDRQGEQWLLRHPTKRRPRRIGQLRFKRKLPLLLKRTLRSKPYLIQQRLPLATYQGRPFDLRVSVQRHADGDWQVSGIAGKVAGRGSYVTNVAQGGSVYRLPELLRDYPGLDPHAVEADVHAFSLRVAEHLSNHLPHLADIGLDIGLTEYGFPLFIECNGRDLRYSFQEAGMIEEWKETYRAPIGYGKYLLEQQQEGIKQRSNSVQWS